MITLLTPTRERPDRFLKMVGSAAAKAVNPENIEIVAVLNKDDKTFDRYPKSDKIAYVRVDKRRNLSGLWDEARKNATGDIFMMCADDFVFTTDGWDAMVEAVFAAVPDRIVMVYGNDGSERAAPVAPFVSKEWVEAAGEFTPDHLQGWFSDEWIWSIAAEVERVVYLPQLRFTHEQGHVVDEALAEQLRHRAQDGGIEGMRRTFYSTAEVTKRDERVARLRRVMKPGIALTPDPKPQWFEQSISWAAGARRHVKNEGVLVVVHCWQGDADLVRDHMRFYKAHDRPVLVLSPEDSPVTNVAGAECKAIGKRGYFGQDSLDRQRAHMEYLLTTEYEYFAMFDADSFCLAPELPSYLFAPGAQNILWSNQANDWRTHPSPYPKIALHPPYFMHRSVMERLLTAADKEQVKAHPITPYIDWYMLALACESNTAYQAFPDGASFPAWRRNVIAETKELGHDFKHMYEADGKIRGDDIMAERVARGAVWLHSVKHKPVADRLARVYETMFNQKPVSEGRVSILVPFRSEQTNTLRDKAWKWVRARWEHIYPDAEIIVGEDNGGEPFSKTTAVNDAYLKATGDVLVVCDADAWMERAKIDRAIDVARRTNRLVVPWKTVVRLNEEDTKKVTRRKPTSAVNITDDMRRDAIETCLPETAGTLYVITRAGFEAVQGMDPRFRGWGMEDVALSRACETLLGPNVYLDDEVYSLYHARPTVKDRGRVWENDPGMQGIDLAKAYASAHRNPGAMRALVNQHPLRGQTAPLRVIERDERVGFREYMETQVEHADVETPTIRVRL